jgi:hypothetical protein
MQPWSPLSEPYVSASGYRVTPASTIEDLVVIGDTLRNGLLLGGPRLTWATLCSEGARQIFDVKSPDGVMVAGGELKSVDGVVAIMFVRGKFNKELVPGDAEFDAVAAYVAAVNGREIPLILAPRASGFVEAGSDAAIESPWDQALRAARAQTISPFAAMVIGYDADRTPDQDADMQVVTWRAVTGPFTAPTGIVIEPITSSSGLHVLGVELENSLFLDGMVASLAHDCAAGRTQVAAIYNGNGIVAFAEFRAVNGQLIASSCRGFADNAPSSDVGRAVLAYVGATNAGLIPLNLSLSADAFVNGPVDDIDPFSQPGGMVYVGSSVPLGQRESFLHQHVDLPSWPALTSAFEADCGVTVTPVTTVDEFYRVSDTLGITVASYDAYERGELAFVSLGRVGYDLDLDDDVMEIVGSAELYVVDGEVSARNGLGIGGEALPEDAAAALVEYLGAVNARTISLGCEISEDGFSYPVARVDASLEDEFDGEEDGPGFPFFG